ncbi:tetratricopeptide repeat protein [Paraburkholderia sp. B3]|uniref:tetratricopeptide repeat protein n=1 Tax=Paraburkholderia sp. B3 TaxID=3134791 RepID=UPI003982742D
MLELPCGSKEGGRRKTSFDRRSRRFLLPSTPDMPVNMRIKESFLCLLVAAGCTGVADAALVPDVGAIDAAEPTIHFPWATASTLPGNAITRLQPGYQAVLAKRYTEALGYLDRAIKADPTPRALLQRGGVYILLGQYRNAVGDFTLALAKSPRLAEAAFGRAEAYYKLNDFPAALTDFNAALALNPDMSVAHLGRGVLFWQMKEYGKAADDFAWVARRDATTDKVNAVNRYKIASQLYDLGHREEDAIACIDAAITLAPEIASLYASRGDLEEDEYGKSLMDYETAIRLDPGDVDARYSLAVLLHEMGQTQASLNEFNELLRTPQSDPYFYVGRGNTLMDMDRDEDALLDNERAAKLDPTSYWVVSQRMQLRFYQGDYAGAARDADTWLSVHEKADEHDAEYALMWRHISTQHMGADDRPYMANAMTHLNDHSAWPYPLIEYAAGKLDERELRAASAHGDPEEMQQRRCETAAYIAEKYLTHNQRSVAEEEFRRAFAICPFDFAERTLAARALKSFPPATVRAQPLAVVRLQGRNHRQSGNGQ